MIKKTKLKNQKEKMATAGNDVFSLVVIQKKIKLFMTVEGRSTL